MKFNTIFSNPPYQGGRQLHQQFFNKAVEDFASEHVLFIQPATPYFNKKKPRKHEEVMQNHIRDNAVEVVFKEGTVFPQIGIFTGLAITRLSVGKAGGIGVTYMNGTEYSDVPLENINMVQMEPNIYASIRAKYLAYIAVHGSLHDIVDYGKGQKQ